MVFCLFCFWTNTISYAQEINTQEIEELIENLIANQESESYDFDTYLETFTYYAENPIVLNTKTSVEDLQALRILSDQQIRSFFKYIAQEKKLVSIYELQAIPYFDLNTIYNILPFVKVKGEIEDFHIPLKKLLFKGTHQLFLRYAQRFPLAKGFTQENNAFVGDPTRLYFRYRYNFSNKISYGITGEKDAGEAFFKENNKAGFDFYSGHLFFKTNTIFKTVALGDYHLKLGQGLLAWTGFGTGKSAYTINVKKTGNEIKPYTSVDEYRFFRGVATQMQIKKWKITPFVSVKAVDANIAYADTLENEIESIGLQTAGLHRSPSEVANKHQVVEMNFGTAVKYGKYDKKIGLNIMHTQFSKTLQQKQKAYNQFKGKGKGFTNASMDYNYLIGTFHFFGENALSYTQKDQHKWGYAFLNGVLFSASKTVDFALVHRYYDKKFVSSLTADAFAEATTPNNENGIYIGTAIRPMKKIKINAYADIYQFNWLRYLVNKPTYGIDFLTQISYRKSRSFEMYLRYKNERKEQQAGLKLNNDALLVTAKNKSFLMNYFGESLQFEQDDLGREILKANKSVTPQAIQNARIFSWHNKQQLRFNARYVLHKKWTFQSRVDFNIFEDEIHPTLYGFMVFQDVGFKALSFPLSFNYRLAYFDVQGWNARIYAYENDVLYQFSIPAFNNRGLRMYLNLRYRIIRGIDVWLRLAHTYYTNIATISSGTNEVPSNHLTELKIQLRFKF